LYFVHLIFSINRNGVYFNYVNFVFCSFWSVTIVIKNHSPKDLTFINKDPKNLSLARERSFDECWKSHID